MAATDHGLHEYERRRDFRRTAEPPGTTASGGAGGRFVIQHHRASSDHYDVRLAVDGVLRSWAVPKGPSLSPRDRRLAVPTEDHPLAYAQFEGTIPADEYGGGIVLVWDAGTYENTTRRGGTEIPMAEALERGHATFRLAGEKLTGGFALTRFRGGDDEAWLLVKQDDAAADARRNPVSTQPESVLSGRDLDAIAAGG